uniref:Uncharacterized protein n=1 Tax=Spongospora subterranea TaxID=70186 RepID=A0A0H5QJD7_9EUKA|eukprot:CRZ02225.1 hypothetical protein [Spongospora subterranea]
MGEAVPILARKPGAGTDIGGDPRAPGAGRIDPAANRFPFCIVFGPLPIISWIIPIIGHMGICDSTGRVHDFAGSYFIGIDDFMVGKVTRYYQIDPWSCSFPGMNPSLSIEERWDLSLASADDEYSKLQHNIFTNNCHHHASCSLHKAGKPWSMIYCWYLITCRGTFVSVSSFIRTYMGFSVLIGIAASLYFSLR